MFRKILQGYLAHQKSHPPRTLPYAYAQGPREVLGEGAFFYGRGTPVIATPRVWVHPSIFPEKYQDPDLSSSQEIKNKTLLSPDFQGCKLGAVQDLFMSIYHEQS
jgi:hypothetical protein